ASQASEMTTKALIAALAVDEERPWVTYSKGEPITDRQLAKLLKPFCIISATVHPPGAPDAKGYRRASFEAVWPRYPSPVLACNFLFPSASRFSEGTTSKPRQNGRFLHFLSVRPDACERDRSAHLAGIRTLDVQKAEMLAGSGFDHGRRAHL